MDYKEYIENIPDFPIKGIQYKDIQPLMGNTVDILNQSQKIWVMF